jgi:hypothetical protein
VRLMKEYGALIDRLARSLSDDFPRFRPVDGCCSPYGVIFGLPSHLIEHMALKALERDAETRFSLEDVFDDRDTGDGDNSAARLAWVNGWRKLPHIDSAVQRLYDYPQQFAEDIYDRIGHELDEASLANRSGSSGKRTGRLYIVRDSNADDPETDSRRKGHYPAPPYSEGTLDPGGADATRLPRVPQNGAAIPELPARYFASSDRQIAEAHKAEPYDRSQLLRERQEGHFLVSYETPGGWIALRKELLAEVLAAGRDARVVGLPLDAAQVLRFMCPDLVIPEKVADQTSVPPSIEKA